MRKKASMSEKAPRTLKQDAQRALEFGQKQVRRLVTTHPDYFPLHTENGRWRHDREAWTNWCEGFLGGMMWIFARHTGDPYWRGKAEHYSRLIEHRKHDDAVHDLGFLFWPTWKQWYDITGDVTLNEVVIEAGRTMASRFNARGRYLPSFVAPESCFIDIMMNVSIVFYAARELEAPELWKIATDHCLTSRRFLVRGDASTAHEGIFDLDTGAFLHQATHQGWRGDSSWARGQAWALYGFASAYEFTGDLRFLDTAQRCADFYMRRTPSHGIPPNDWEEPGPSYPFESSAAAATASGLLKLSELADEPARGEQYRRYSHTILQTLCTREFLAVEEPEWEGILKHGIYHRSKGLGVDESVMWGEYFFMEAIDRFLEDTDGAERAIGRSSAFGF
jgi:unsaturated chondroitin disaccharide hydrolase